PHDVQVLLNLDVLIGLGHAAWKGPMYETGDATLAPQARVSAAQTHDRYRLWSAELPGISAQNAHHLVVGVADTRRAVVELFQRRLGIPREDLADLGHHLVFAQPGWHANVGLKPARPRHDVHFQATLNHADVDGDARHNVLSTGPLRLIDGCRGAGEGMGDVDGQRRLEGRLLVEIEDEARRELCGARRQVRVSPMGARGLYCELEPEWPFLAEANGERAAWLAVQ